MAGKDAAPAAKAGGSGGDSSTKTAKGDKSKKLLSYKDKQMSALAGQLQQAGHKPDFSSVKRGRSESTGRE